MSFEGCLVSLDCGSVLGTYQGQVKVVDNATQLLTISHAYRNGIKCEVPEITISAGDIKNLKILKTANEALTHLPKQTTPSKLSKETELELDQTASPGKIKEVQSNRETNGNPVPNGYRQTFTPTKDRYENGGGQVASGSRFTPTRDRYEEAGLQQRLTPTGIRYDQDGTGSSHRNGNAGQYTPTKDESFRTRRNSASDQTRVHKSSAPRKIEFRKKSVNRQDCFSAPVESLLDDFDFEKNLALFDKKAVFREIESSYPVLIKAAEKKAPTKYRCDENVLQSGPVVLQQIKVPCQTGTSYVTDSGLVIPCIDYDLRNSLFSAAEEAGFTVERRLEMIGRSSSEMVLQLIGGSNRLNPQNGHQLPTVVVLCGPHIQGAQGITCARHLVSHGVKTILFLPNFVRMVQSVEQELRLYENCDGHRYSNPQETPNGAVDMIVNCMDSHENSFLQEQSWYKIHAKWIQQSRAPVFAIDPPADGAIIPAKWSLCPALPLHLSDNTSQLYLCDLGMPSKVFEKVGISYKSPFGHKFIIPVHQRA